MFAVLLILFFGSGISGLIYELVWLRYLSPIFGVTIYAVSTVLSAFMGGLALGGYLAVRVAGRVKRPLRACGLMAIGIGLSALGTPPAFGLLAATTYAFTLILCTFLLGIALRSYAVTPLIERRTNWLFAAAVMEWAIGVTALISIAVISRLNGLVDALGRLPLVEHAVSGEHRTIALMCFVTGIDKLARRRGQESVW